ncbi:MAG: GNAT family N-acetyltransferase [Thermomicrobiales bacterium]
MTNPNAAAVETVVQEVFGEDVLTRARFIADYAFGKSPEAPNAERHAAMLKYGTESRFFTALADDRPQATATIHAMTENIRGAVVSMGGVGGVASLPSGRRQGHVRNLFAQLFAEMRSDGQVVSTLYPFRESFYERLGYATFTAPRYVTLDPAHLAPIMRVHKPGWVEQLPMSEGWETFRAFVEQYQQGAHGFSLRDRSHDIRNQDENTAWVAFAYDPDGAVVGAMTFTITGYTERMEVSALLPMTTAAKYLLLEWIGRHADQVTQVVVRVGADEFAELWVRDLNETISTADKIAWPAPMGRVIDVAGLTGIGAGDGEILLQIADDYASWNTGVFRFTGAGGLLTVEAVADAAAEATITIQGLSSLVFTGQNPADFPFRGWGDPDEAAQATLRGMFPFVAPNLYEEF